MDGRMRQGGGPPGKRNRGRGGRRVFSPRNQVLDSNGPSVRIRGNALQIYEKYQQLARDLSISGDRVAAENLLQHAEHYYRIHSATNGGNGTNGVDRRPREDGQPGEAKLNGDSGQGGSAEASTEASAEASTESGPGPGNDSDGEDTPQQG